MAGPATNLSGRWVGAYEQHGQSGPIEAEFAVDDQGQLTGTMHDVVTDRELSLFDATAAAGLPPGTDERIEAALREAFPDRTRHPIRFVTHLPPESDLVGVVSGHNVSFLKTYRGESHSGYRVGSDVLVGGQVSNHQVHYWGKLDPSGQAMEGRWWIEADLDRGTKRADGSFILRRVAGTRGGESVS